MTKGRFDSHRYGTKNMSCATDSVPKTAVVFELNGSENQRTNQM